MYAAAGSVLGGTALSQAARGLCSTGGAAGLTGACSGFSPSAGGHGAKFSPPKANFWVDAAPRLARHVSATY
jgi:hypothetical protein